MLKKFGLLGHNISYSLSPKIHTEYYKANGIDAVYELIDTPVLVSVFDRLRCMDGFNVTQPYKQEILPYINEFRAPMLAINTVKIIDGKFIGYNTDGAGFHAHVKELNIDFKDKVALVLGAGGAATAIVPIVASEGAKVFIYNRSFEKASTLATACYCEGHRPEAISRKGMPKLKPQVIINCTTLGLKGENCLPCGIDLSRLEFAYDTIYNPPLTPFLTEAKKQGANTANGYRMLECQAYEAIKIWLE